MHTAVVLVKIKSPGRKLNMGVDFIDTSSIGDCLDSNNLSAVLLCTANSFLFFFFFWVSYLFLYAF